MGFAFGSSGGGKQKTEYPQWITSAGQSAVNRAGTIAKQPYQPYGGQRVAPFSPTQTAAVGRAGTGAGMVQRGFDLTGDVAGTEWDSEQASKYMSPYIESALQPTIRMINEQSGKDAIGARAGTVHGGGVGAFGDARTAIMEGELEEARLRGVGDVTARGYADAYDRAFGAFADTENRRLQAAGQMGAQGGQYGALNATDFALGEAEQDQAQRGLDVGYSEYLEERDWAQRGLDAYVRALSGVPFETETSVPGASVAQQATGAAFAGAGLYSMFF